MQNPADIPEIGGEIPVKRRRYPRKSRVFHGLDLRTARGRRIRSLHQAYAERFDDQADESVAEQPIIQAAILRVAKLQVIVERLQDELLKPKRHNRQLGDELVRHENMLRRAKEELMALIPEPLSWWERRQREREQEETANGEER